MHGLNGTCETASAIQCYNLASTEWIRLRILKPDCHGNRMDTIGIKSIPQQTDALLHQNLNQLVR